MLLDVLGLPFLVICHPPIYFLFLCDVVQDSKCPLIQLKVEFGFLFLILVILRTREMEDRKGFTASYDQKPEMSS